MRIIFLSIIMSVLFQACGPASQEQQAEVQVEYGEPYRPQFHFSPASGWMNDPNGLVFHKGEYHLFYQHYPDSTVWGPMHWGHAVSTDLTHWEHLPIALYPDSLGYIFSGSAVVDRENTTGFGTKENPPLVAMFTYHDPVGEREGRNDFQTQGIAYSIDNGRTWTKYEGNPVLKNPGIRDFRDPKVSWWEEQKKWLLALAVKDHVEFYASPDMKNWTKLSEFGKDTGVHGGVWECPDFFPMQDANGKTHWVLLLSINPGGPQGGSATQYFIGDFDGKKFTPQDKQIRWIDYGADNYAGVTWSDIIPADGRRLFIGWMSNWQYANVVPTGVWRSATTLPREIILEPRSSKYELTFKPVDELQGILGKQSSHMDSLELTGPTARIHFPVSGSEGFDCVLKNAAHEQLLLSFADGKFTIDRTEAGLKNFSVDFAAVHTMDLSGLNLREVELWIDAASVEVFINRGERVMTDIVFPSVAWDRFLLKKSNPEFSFQPVERVWSGGLNKTTKAP